MTTNCVNHQFELKVTDKLLWDSCGYASEKNPELEFLSKLDVPGRDHPFPLLAADALHSNGAPSEQGRTCIKQNCSFCFMGMTDWAETGFV